MGASQPGRKWGGYSAGYNWSHEAAVMGAYAKSPELRSAYAKTLEQMRKEQAPDPDDLDRCPGIDAEIDQRLAQANGAKSWLPLVDGGEYRTMGGFKAICFAHGSVCGDFNGCGQSYGIDASGRLWKRCDAWVGVKPEIPDSDLDLIGPWNPKLEGIDPPPGYQFTGEFRIPLDGEIVSHCDFDGTPKSTELDGTGSEQKYIRNWAQNVTAGKCWILVPRPVSSTTPTNSVAQAARPKRRRTKQP